MEWPVSVLSTQIPATGVVNVFPLKTFFFDYIKTRLKNFEGVHQLNISKCCLNNF